MLVYEMASTEKTSPTATSHVIDIEEQAQIWRRVPTLVRQEPQGKAQIYVPVLVSLGPYYHGLAQFDKVEALKAKTLVPSPLHPKLLDKIRHRLGKVRSFYGVAAQKYSDEELADMMLRDACFVVYCMRTMTAYGEENKYCVVHRCLGMSRVAFLVRDFFMLENQLPFWILKEVVLAGHQPSPNYNIISHEDDDHNDHGNNGCETFFCNLLSSITSGNREKEKPIHLLHARRTTLLQKDPYYNNSGDNRGDDYSNNSCHCWFVKSRDDDKAKKKKKEKEKEKEKKTTRINPFRSVTDLKAMGIHFRPSSYCLTDISFCSHSFYGMLRLPILSLDNKTNVIFSNIIAFEMAADSRSDFAVISYVKLMKSLIEKAEDVKELREKSIIQSCSADDGEVVRMFKEFNTEGSCGKDMFREIRERVNEHCNSKSKTFKAELIHTYFRSPWTAIALFAAILILCINCLNFILNYYRAHAKTNKQD